MKKVLFIMFLLVSMGANAQSLIGTWSTHPETDEDGDKTSWGLVFHQGNKMILRMTMASNDDEVGSFEFVMDIPGTYKHNGNTLTINVDPQKTTGKMENMVYKGEMAKLIKESPEMKETFEKMIKNQIEEEITKGFADQAAVSYDVTITKLTANSLFLKGDKDFIVDSNNDFIEFFRVK